MSNIKDLLKNKTDQDSDVMVLSYGNDSGKGLMYLCELYEGIYIWTNDVKIRYLNETAYNEACLKMNFCLSGRCELETEDERFIYVDESVISFGEGNAKDTYTYPTGHYFGLEFGFYKNDINEETASFLKGIGFTYDQWSSLQLGTVNDSCREEMTSLCYALYHRKENKEAYRIAFLNILYKLTHGAFTSNEHQCYLTKGQRRIARETEQLLTSDLQSHPSIPSIALKYNISPSSLKKYFTLAYGKPVTEYMQEYRCGKAEEYLLTTDWSVGEIANVVGYSHQGKFSEIFKRYTGCNPLEYRMRNEGGNHGFI